MIRQYVDEALHRASYSVVDDNVYFATVTGLPGAIATGATLGICRDQLAAIVEEWVLLRVSRGLSIPRIRTARIQVRRVR
jgi:predicted RNase H-like HicB family nuclease